MRCLIAEDSKTNSILYKKICSKYFTCDLAENGKEAFNLFKNMFNTEKKYNLICLDIDMPELDGIETLKKIRDYEAKMNVEGLDRAKIIMVTVLDDYGNITSSFEQQCDAYITKPMDIKKFENTIKKIGLFNELKINY